MSSAPSIAQPPAAPQTAPPPDAQSARALDGALLHGIAWTAGMRWVGQVVSWASTLVVARLLSPEDYGLVGMATWFLGLMTMMSEFGMDSAVVTLRTLTPIQLAQLNSVALVMGAGGFLIGCLAAVPLGWLFDAPQLPPVVVVMSLTFIITSFKTVPSALMQRDLDFKRLAILDTARGVILALATVCFALLGFRYWTLVLGGLLSALITTILYVANRPQGFARPHFATVRPALGFSRHIIVQRLSWYLYANADFFAAGKMLGKAALGAYTLAWTLANIPIDKVTALVVRVAPGIFSGVQTDRAALRRYVLLMTEGLALVTFPATVGLALVADDFVVLALGEKWRVMVLPLQLLALYSSVRSITPLFAPVLNVTGDARFAARNNLLALAILPAAFLIGARWGTLGIAAAWMIAHPIVVLPLARRTFRRLELPAGRYLAALWPALSACAAMVVAVLALRTVVPITWPLLARVSLLIAGGAVAYGAVVLALHRARVRAFLGVVRAAKA